MCGFPPRHARRRPSSGRPAGLDKSRCVSKVPALTPFDDAKYELQPTRHGGLPPRSTTVASEHVVPAVLAVD
jgi:hypothetical protein